MERLFKTILILFYLAGLGLVVNALVTGWGYYATPLMDRPWHADHALLKPGGLQGHGYGIAGMACLVLLLTYSVRKRTRLLNRFGSPRRWMDVHVFLGIVGPLLIAVHAAGKLNGLVAVAFWAMVVVAASGFFGRYLYAQIPHDAQGAELSRSQAEAQRDALVQDAGDNGRRQNRLERQLRRWAPAHRLFHLWHVFHKPLAALMYLVAAVHIAVALWLGYRWVF